MELVKTATPLFFCSIAAPVVREALYRFRIPMRKYNGINHALGYLALGVGATYIRCTSFIEPKHKQKDQLVGLVIMCFSAKGQGLIPASLDLRFLQTIEVTWSPASRISVDRLIYSQ